MCAAIPRDVLPPDAADALACLWSALDNDTDIGLSVQHVRGRTLWCSPSAVAQFLGHHADPTVYFDRSWESVGAPGQWIDERLALYQDAARTGNPFTLRSIWNGSQIVSRVVPLRVGTHPADRMLTISRRTPGPLAVSEASTAIIYSRYARLGTLDALTERELELLSLITQGHSLDDVALLWHRAPKTVKHHRDAITRKLAPQTRADLYRLAFSCGLTPEDARRQRV